MHPAVTVAAVLELAREGASDTEIAEYLGIPRPTVRDWTAGRLPRSFAPKGDSHGSACTGCGGNPHQMQSLPADYAYLLGLYLGDGVISAHRRRVYRLRIYLDKRYPGIVASCKEAMGAVMPANSVNAFLKPDNCFEVSSYSKAWPCLFPQAGPGMKHTRRIELADWQRELMERHPKLLLRGLIHSDGCRFINTGTGGWRCPRYAFSNTSDDILGIFCDTCDLLGVRWTTAPRTVYVSRKSDVEFLDTFIGPKR